LLEHPRLFWRDQGELTYNSARSIEATNSGITFSNQPQDFFFDVGNIPTWSGIVRSFSVQPWVTATGLGFSAHINNIEVFHSSEQDRLALVAQSPSSGTQVIGGGSEQTSAILLATHSQVEQACIITGIEYFIHPPCDEDNAAFFLVRFKEGGNFPSPGSNFEVKHIHLIKENLRDRAFDTPKIHEPVFWGAEPGDFIGFGWSSNSNCGFSEFQRYTRTTGAAAGIGFQTSGFISAGTNTGTLQALLDTKTFTDNNTRYNLRYSFIVDQPVVANGTFTTPIFDTAAAPGLTSARLESTEEDGTSVDTVGGLSSAENTLNARADISPPKTSTPLGQLDNFRDNFNKEVVSYRLNAGNANAENQFEYLGSASTPDNVTTFSLGTENAFLSAIGPTGIDSDTYVENFGAALFYHEVEDELWVLNVMLSGTIPNAIAPVWDRYNIDTGALISTDALQGFINYSYFHPDGTSNSDIDARIFEPICFLPNYDREEIYIIGRLPNEGNGTGPFAVASTRFLGLKMDLGGTFKSLIWDTASAAFDTNMPTANPEVPIENMRDITYDGSYFYVLTSVVDPTFENGKNIYIYKWGLDDGPLGGSEPDTLRFLQNIEINAIPGLGAIGTDSSPVRWLEYNKRDGLFYLGVEDPSDAVYAIRLSPDENEVFTATTEGPQNVSFQIQPSPLPETFVRVAFGASDTNKLNNWRGAGQVQRYRYITDVAFIESRNSFVSLTMNEAFRSKDWFDIGQFVADHFAYRFHNYSFITEVGGGGVFESELPSIPAIDDAVWGTLSGTLEYNLVQENSALFPTGQFSQLQYQLNADPSSIETPYLNKSQISQGLRVENIPANGTKSIFLRTNIPEGTSIELQTGRLKVFWELQE